MSNNKYQREIKPGVNVDVYEVLKAFNVTCPAMAHAIKKCLAPGQRGVKDSTQDKNEAIASIKRSIEMEGVKPDLIEVGDRVATKHGVGIVRNIIDNPRPSCFGRKLGVEACFHFCSFQDKCYE